ncbi:MAG: efflux RND transporter periplasmic adaptor subunit [Gemmatimonadota bacterium]|nr:efflux RND transporter periplasmic adaptor subunit [Gemmatimonadota bacterium]
MRGTTAKTAAVAILSVACMAGCSDRGKKPVPEAGDASKQPTVAVPSRTAGRDIALSAVAIEHAAIRWAAASERAVAGGLEVPGQLVANEDRTARLGAPAEARVLAVHVQLGDRVRVDQPLVTLQSGEATTARADHSKALADLNARKAAATYARAARERADRLLIAKAIPRQDVERSAADDELARSEVARAEAEVARARTELAHLGVGRDGNMVLRSPINGVILSRDAKPGTVVQPGAPLVAVSDPATLWIDVSVSERSASALRAGSRLRFAVPAYPSDTFAARVVSVGAALDPETRSIVTRALVDNSDGRLRAQMYGTVWLDGSLQRAVSVPEIAVMLLDERSVVFVAHPGANGSARFERRDVTIGGTSAGMVQILTGVVPGELVVTDGAFAVKSEFSRSKMSGG